MSEEQASAEGGQKSLLVVIIGALLLVFLCGYAVYSLVLAPPSQSGKIDLPGVYTVGGEIRAGEWSFSIPAGKEVKLYAQAQDDGYKPLAAAADAEDSHPGNGTVEQKLADGNVVDVPQGVRARLN